MSTFLICLDLSVGCLFVLARTRSMCTINRLESSLVSLTHTTDCFVHFQRCTFRVLFRVAVYISTLFSLWFNDWFSNFTLHNDSIMYLFTITQNICIPNNTITSPTHQRTSVQQTPPTNDALLLHYWLWQNCAILHWPIRARYGNLLISSKHVLDNSTDALSVCHVWTWLYRQTCRSFLYVTVQLCT